MNERADMSVRDAMTGAPVAIDGLVPVDEALTIMRERNISCLVVDRRDEEDEYGLLLISDIAREILGKSRPVSRTHVYEVMQKPAPTLAAEMKIRYAARFMGRFGLSHCVVLSGRTLAGIVTLRDLTIRLLD